MADQSDFLCRRNVHIEVIEDKCISIRILKVDFIEFNLASGDFSNFIRSFRIFAHIKCALIIND